MLIQLIPGAAEKPFGAIMLAVDPKEMESILQSLSPYPDGSALLLDQNQEVLFHEGEIDFEKTLLKEVKTAGRERPFSDGMGRQGVFRLLWRHEPYASAVDLCVSGASFCHYSADGVFIESDYRDACHLHLLGGVHDVVCIKKSTVPYSICLAYLPVERRKHGRRPGRMNSSGLKSDGMIYPLKAESFKSNSCGRHPI